jgi:hypothetical protein
MSAKVSYAALCARNSDRRWASLRLYIQKPNKAINTPMVIATRVFSVSRRIGIQYRDDADTVRLIHEQSTSTSRYRRRMYGRYETATLGDVDDDSYYYGVHCNACEHHARLSLRKLRDYLGDTFAVNKIRERLRCERCR